MPGTNRTGPEGLGPMTGRGNGFCGGGCGVAPGCNRGSGRGWGRGMRNGYGPAEGAGNGRGRSFGPGIGRSAGPGRGLGWFSAGYSGAGDRAQEATTAVEIKSALENRAGFLRAELARTEAMLTADPGNRSTQSSRDTIEDEGK